MDTKKLIISDFSQFLKTHSFKKRGSVWVLQKNEFLVIIDLQKSQWSNIYYVNVGLQLENLEEKLPKAHNAEISYRVVDQYGNDSQGNFDLVRDLALIKDLVKLQVIEKFANLQTKSQLKEQMITEPKRYFVSVLGKKLLSLPVGISINPD